MSELTDSGVLVPMRVLSCTQIDMKGAATSGGEWTDKAAAERGMQIVGDIVSEWVEHGENRKTICFGATIAHCEELCRQFNESGVMAGVFCSNTKEKERKALRDEFKKPDSAIRVLISVVALAKGFDQPDVSCIIDARPLRKSLSEVIQMWGRGLRASPDTGKIDCLLLDHSGNVIRFREDFEKIYFNGLEKLDDGEKLDSVVRQEPEDFEPKGCPACGHKPFVKHCTACGFEIVKPSLVSAEAGEMVEIILGKKKLANDERHLWEQLVSYARKHSAPEKQRGRASHLFKDMVGHWPNRDWAFDATPTVEISANVANNIRSRNIRRVKGLAKGAH